MIRPDGETAGGGTTLFKVSNAHLMYRTRLNLAVFPIGQTGLVWLQNRIRPKTDPESEWQETARFPLLVIHHEVEKKEEVNEKERPAEEVGSISEIRDVNEAPSGSA